MTRKGKHFLIPVGERLYKKIMEQAEPYSVAVTQSFEHWTTGGALPGPVDDERVAKKLLIRADDELLTRVNNHVRETGVPYAEAGRRFLKLWTTTGKLPARKPAKKASKSKKK